MRKSNYIGVLYLILVSCSHRVLKKTYSIKKTERLYSESIQDAAKPQSWEIYTELTKVNDTNIQLVRKEIKGETYILAVSWKDKVDYYKNDSITGFYKTNEKYPIWVSLAPELQNICSSSKFGKKEGVDLRLKQILGMPPTVVKSNFVSFWVKPQDLFRPCPDSEITDTECQLSFPKNTSETYVKWINDLRIQSYYHEQWDSNYPWTELGYTYDWNSKNKSNIGVSEFVIKGNANIVVDQFYTTAEYCNCKE